MKRRECWESKDIKLEDIIRDEINYLRWHLFTKPMNVSIVNQYKWSKSHHPIIILTELHKTLFHIYLFIFFFLFNDLSKIPGKFK